MWVTVIIVIRRDTCEISYKVRKKAKIRNQYNQVPQLTQITTWESDKSIRKRNIQESQEVSLFPAGDQMLKWTDKKAWQTLKINNKNDPQKKWCLGTVNTIIFTGGLKLVYGINLTLISDVDQDK